MDDDGESVVLGLGVLPERVSAGTPNQAAVSITDDDSVGVTISGMALTIVEGDSDTYSVVLDSEPVDSVIVTISGHTGTDVSLSTTTLTFSSESWDTPQTVTVTAEQDVDAIDEGDVTLVHIAGGSRP